MSRPGVIAAQEYAEGLASFESPEAAHEQLLAALGATVSALLREQGVPLGLDFSPESLRRLERWFLESGCPETGDAGYSIPHAIGFYFGEILCRTSGFRWVVDEHPLGDGRYEIGIRRPLLSIMLTKGRRPVRVGNERMHSLWREWDVYARTIRSGGRA
jgi:hypothetical protein